jgi:GNAT superfamily N-acetyltransferase
VGQEARPSPEKATEVNIRIEQVSRNEFSALRTIELASFETLRTAGAVTGEATASSDEELQHYLDSGFLLAAFDEGGVPVGYGGGYVADGWLHIGEVDVHPDLQRQGIGRKLLEALLDRGRARELKGATLTTDRFAPFNAPFYTSLGFKAIEEEACPARLKAILDKERKKGLDPHRRIAMMLGF